MKIQEFAEKYGMEKRRIDYLTNLGFLHPEVDEHNGYRDYNQVCEEEAKRIIIIEAMGWSVTERTIQKLSVYDEFEVENVVLPLIEAERKRLEERTKKAIAFANEMQRG